MDDKVCWQNSFNGKPQATVPDIHSTESVGTIPRIGGSSQWTEVTYEIDVPEDQRMIELVLELRARLGKAWFDRESLRLVRTEVKP
jgi:hypothetical protein